LDGRKEEPNSFLGLMERMMGREVEVVEPLEDDLANLIYTSGKKWNSWVFSWTFFIIDILNSG
jgi:hypothetical protein